MGANGRTSRRRRRLTHSPPSICGWRGCACTPSIHLSLFVARSFVPDYFSMRTIKKSRRSPQMGAHFRCANGRHARLDCDDQSVRKRAQKNLQNPQPKGCWLLEAVNERSRDYFRDFGRHSTAKKLGDDDGEERKVKEFQTATELFVGRFGQWAKKGATTTSPFVHSCISNVYSSTIHTLGRGRSSSV